MSGPSMMFMGAAWMALAWIFVHYYGVNGSRAAAFVLGSALFAAGTVHTIMGLVTR